MKYLFNVSIRVVTVHSLKVWCAYQHTQHSGLMMSRLGLK